MRTAAAIRRRRAVGAVAVLAALVVPAFVAATVDRSGTVAEPAVRLDPPEPMLLVSDSAWLSLRIYGSIDAVQGVEHVLDLASCRRRVSRSCRNYDGSVPITLYDELDVHGDNFHTLVVATGYNDSDVGFADDVDAIVTRARALSYERVVWLTLRSNVSYTSPDMIGFAEVFASNNEAIAAIEAAGTYPELVVADWATYARDRPEWFASDGIHLSGHGPWAASDYVSRKLAFLDGRACPQPVVEGQIPPEPCPDPDTGPPAVDLPSLYPIGTPNPTARFELEFEGSGAWPDPPFWQS